MLENTIKGSRKTKKVAFVELLNRSDFNWYIYEPYI